MEMKMHLCQVLDNGLDITMIDAMEDQNIAVHDVKSYLPFDINNCISFIDVR